MTHTVGSLEPLLLSTGVLGLTIATVVSLASMARYAGLCGVVTILSRMTLGGTSLLPRSGPASGAAGTLGPLLSATAFVVPVTCT